MSVPNSLNDENKSRMVDHFNGDGPPASERWSALWDKGDVPWDQGLPNPALIDTMKHCKGLVGHSTFVDENGDRRRKRALVPGCGRGYDVLVLSSFGYDAYGLEVSAKAIGEAKEWTQMHESDYPVADPGVGAGKVQFVLGDFFDNGWFGEADGAGKFELIYDFTFFCALSPSVRPAWAFRYTQLLSSRPDSAIVCVEFPTFKPFSSGGPPFAAPPSAYEAHMSHPGVEIPYDREGNISKPAGIGENGFQRVGHWKAERTHEMGKDKDWVSVWKRYT